MTVQVQQTLETRTDEAHRPASVQRGGIKQITNERSPLQRNRYQKPLSIDLSRELYILLARPPPSPKRAAPLASLASRIHMLIHTSLSILHTSASYTHTVHFAYSIRLSPFAPNPIPSHPFCSSCPSPEP